MDQAMCLDSTESIVKSIVDNPPIILHFLEEEIDDLFAENQEFQDIPKFSNRKSAPRNRNRAYALEEMHLLSDAEFSRMFRLNREAFYWLRCF
jgi:hypothetical protein